MAIIIAILMFIAAALLFESEREKLKITSCEYRITTEKRAEMTLVFLSDLHDYLPARHDPGKIMELIDAARPDAVLLGGDMITVSKHRKHPVPDTETAIKFARNLREKYEVYYAEGNHEARYLEKDPVGYAAYVKALTDLGVHYLPNAAAKITVRKPDAAGPADDRAAENAAGKNSGSASGNTAVVYGFTLPDECFQPLLFRQKETVRLPEGFLESVLHEGEREEETYRIGMIHSPRYLKDAAKAGLDLVLSGHFHGGTIRLPDGSGLMTPQYQFFVKECSGTFTEGKTTMIVNRGLGTHSIKIRINDIPEVSVIHIETADHL